MNMTKSTDCLSNTSKSASESECESDYEEQVDEFGNTIETGRRKPVESESEDDLPPAPVAMKVIRYSGQENCSKYKQSKATKKALASCRQGWIESGQMNAAGDSLFGGGDDISEDLGVCSRVVQNTFVANRKSTMTAWEQHVANQRKKSKEDEKRRQEAVHSNVGK
jgi:hypothetical protein